MDTHKNIEWKQQGSSIEVVQAVNDGVPFVIVVEGQAARILTKTNGFGTIGLTPPQVKVIVAITAIVGVAGLLLYALSQGYKIKGKARTPDGTVYELEFEPPDRE